jgi:ABC-type amino acid transport substrate-binding protein
MLQKLFVVFTIFVLFPFILLANESKTYKVGCNENYYPYIVKNNETGELEGIIIDWWNLWAEKAEVEIEFIPLDLQSCIEKTTNGEIDAIAGLFYSDERSEILDFTEPLVRMKTVLFLKKGIKSDSIGSIRESIGVLKNDLAHITLENKYPGLQLEVLDNIELLRDKIQHKTINAFVYDIPSSITNYKTVKPPKGYYIFDTLYAEKLRAAVKSGNSEMLKLVIAGAAKMTDEEIVTIAKNYDLFNPARTWLWIVIIVALFIGVILALSISHLFSSKKKIKEMEEYVSKTDWKLIIDKGENDKIEFKSSLRWDYRLEKANKVLEKVIAKTVSAFLNADGGILFIGVDDDGNILGLDKDYSCLSKNNRDGFLLALTTIINVHLGKSSHKFISINIISINEKDVCIVNVEPSDKPVFMGKNDNEEFYIRASASSQPLGVRETYKYINSRWK